MTAITENVKRIKALLPENVMLVAASKMNSADAVREAVAAGVDACGENRVQELLQKNAEGAYTGAPLHFIGHLQKNKVKNVVGLCDLIQSVDSLELLELIDRRAAALGIRQEVLLEVNIARELSKSGFPSDVMREVPEKCGRFNHVLVRGLMCIPPIEGKSGQNRAYFQVMRQLFVDIGAKKYDNISMDFLSMGMSGDFLDAAAEGANIVRVGSAIFGARDYGAE